MSQILIVDDEPDVRKAIAATLRRANHHCVFAGSYAEALGKLDEGSYEIVLSDINMPGQSGIELVKHVRQAHPDSAVVMVTGVDDPEVAQVALDLGAYGYLIKPYSINELLIAVANAQRRRELERSIFQHQEELEREIVSRTNEAREALRFAQEETILRLARAAEFRDNETAQHVQRMSRYCAVLAKHLGIDDDRCETIRLASILHDVGKIGIPDQILLKPAKLTPEEFTIIKTHSEIGYRILTGSEAELLTLAATVAFSHHEKFDGSGYPQGLKGHAIPVEGRLAAIADVFDAVTSNRVYREPIPVEEAITLLKAGRGTHFDPQICDIFIASIDEMLAVKATYADGHRS